MSDTQGRDVQAAKDEAVENVVERVESYQDGAEQSTVADELRHGLDEAGVDVPEQDVDALAEQIHRDGEAGGTDDVEAR